jgi:glutamyl-tRNA synthetase/glutamyl-Q tRNA(Asp) synthetase
MATRVAPSMTGYLHLGHLYHLLWVYAYAERMGVPVCLRIEDHDRSRARPAYEKALFADLAAFGMAWRGDVLRQQDDVTFYDQQVAMLQDAGLVYGCACSRRELADLQLAGAPELFYPGRCSEKKLPLEGHTVRFRVGPDRMRFKDERLGWQEHVPAQQCGDFAIRDRTGQYTYQFCCVCDDIRQEIRHVVRGEDVLPSTGRQLQLFHAFDAPAPTYLHHPLLCDEAGNKWSKRQHAVSLRSRLEKGVSPEQLLAEAVGLHQPISLATALECVTGQLNQSAS